MEAIAVSSILSVYFVLIAFFAISYWKVLEKAGLPGWGMFIPFYNIYLHFKMAGMSGWNILLLFIPIVNIITILVANVKIARRFNKPDVFGFGMTVIGFIFYPILAFGDAEYDNPVAYYREVPTTEVMEDGSVAEKIEVDENGQW